MPAAVRIVAGRVTAPGTTLTGWTLNTGDSLTILNTAIGANIWLAQVWGQQQVAGALRIRSPRLHDNVSPLRWQMPVGDIRPIWPMGFKQRLYPQDLLVVEQSGSAVAGQFESGALLMYYEDLPGINARLRSTQAVMSSTKNIVMVQVTLTLGVGGGYTGEVALNSGIYNLIANTDYALVGAVVDTAAMMIGIRGVDSGNVRTGFPGDNAGRFYTPEWFLLLSDALGLPCIPIWNSANAASILIDGVQNQAGSTTIVNLILAQM